MRFDFGKVTCVVLAIAFSLVSTPGPAMGQSRTASGDKSASQQASPDRKDPEEILVEALLGDNDEPPDSIDTDPQLTRGRRRLDERAEQFARCLPNFKLDLLHKIIDGPPNYSSTRFALGRLMQLNKTCYPGANLDASNAIALGSCNPASIGGGISGSGNALESAADGTSLDTRIKDCRNFYDRGAILRAAIAKYAPDLGLTRKQTTDHAVQARLNQREVPRNRYRRGEEELFFKVAICMVRLQPKLSVQLVRTGMDRGAQHRLEGAIIRGARDCIGGAKRIETDPIFFRNFITDAVYRWAVAARDVDSLLPAKS